MFVRQAFRPATRAFTKSFTRSNFTQPIHTQKNYSKYIIGGLVGAGATLWFAKDYFSAEEAKVALSPTEYRPFAISEVIRANHNTNFYVVKLPEGTTGGLTTASFVMIKGKDKDGKDAERPYTPVSPVDRKGELVFLIKSYPNGNVSKYLGTLQPGDSIDILGPYKKLDYKPNMKKQIAMIAGGTGITPMVQIIREVLNNPEDTTKITLLYANVSEEDILLKETLDVLSNFFPKRFEITYVLDHPKDADSWSKKGGSVGYVTEDLIKEKIPAPSEDVLVLFCGPPPMQNIIAGPLGANWTQGELKGYLANLGYNADQVYKF